MTSYSSHSAALHRRVHTAALSVKSIINETGRLYNSFALRQQSATLDTNGQLVSADNHSMIAGEVHEERPAPAVREHITLLRLLEGLRTYVKLVVNTAPPPPGK